MSTDWMEDHKKNQNFALALLLVVLVFLTILEHFIVVFEDGSFGIGTGYPWWISGCIPWHICALGG